MDERHPLSNCHNLSFIQSIAHIYIHKVDSALFKYLAYKKICSLYTGDHLIKGSSDYKVLINEGKHGVS